MDGCLPPLLCPTLVCGFRWGFCVFIGGFDGVGDLSSYSDRSVIYALSRVGVVDSLLALCMWTFLERPHVVIVLAVDA